MTPNKLLTKSKKIKRMSYHIISRKIGHDNRHKVHCTNVHWKYCVNLCVNCPLSIPVNTITKSNEDRVLDLIGVMPNSAEKNRYTWLISM